MPIAEDILRCPGCGGELEREESELHCKSCKTSYHKMEGLWDLIPSGSSTLKLSERSHYSAKKDCYLDLHEAWCTSPFYRHYHHSFLQDLRALPPGSLILETGCGLGHDGLELLISGYRVVETDIAPGQLREALRLHAMNGFSDRSNHLLADTENLPFASDSFDGAFMVASLHHLPDPLRALREMRRVLREGGILVLGTEPNSWQKYTIYPCGKLLIKLVWSFSKMKMDPTELVSEADKLMEGFSGRHLRALLSEAGFSHIQLKPAGYLSAGIFFVSTELSSLTGRMLRMFPLERLAIPLDEILGRMPLLSRYPWHWNAVAS